MFYKDKSRGKQEEKIIHMDDMQALEAIKLEKSYRGRKSSGV